MNTQPEAQAAGTGPSDRFAVPSTISSGAAQRLGEVYSIIQALPARKPSVTAEEFEAANAQMEALVGPMVKALSDELGIIRTKDVLGGVPVLRMKAPNYDPKAPILIYVHGGGYVTFSAETSLSVPSQIAVASGCEVISIDYTLAPKGDWRNATEEVNSVWRTLLQTGLDPKRAGLFGDSAGGALAAGAVLRLRDEGEQLPGALWLLSPWSDITETGDTVHTLSPYDPSLTLEVLSSAAGAYAEPADRKHPYVSPVYGDYSKAFPPTLIQVGTRELFLSHAVRHYQAIKAGGHLAVLDVYEGMPHVFQALAPGVPETIASIATAAAFFDQHLREA